jgi:pimeloyl-ACP methyl ester carboxylesterase
MADPRFLAHNGAALAYRHTPGAGPMLVFLPGYMSDMAGSKAEAVAASATARGQACLRLDYSGCGASGGDFLAGSIGRWTDDALAVIDHVAPGGRVVLIGSSMGGWIALRLALRLGGRVTGLVGIAAAPDFTRWGLSLTAADHAALATQGWFNRPSDYDAGGYRYSRALIDDAPAQLLLDAEIAVDAPVRLLQGQQDDAVPWATALDIAARLRSGDVQVTLIKDGDHRLSRPQDIARLLATIEDLIAP